VAPKKTDFDFKSWQLQAGHLKTESPTVNVKIFVFNLDHTRCLNTAHYIF